MTEDRCSVFIVGLPQQEQEQGEDSQLSKNQNRSNKLADEENRYELLSILKEAFGEFRSEPKDQYDSNLKLTGIRVVFRHENAARDTVKIMHDQLFSDNRFRLQIFSDVFKPPTEEERKKMMKLQQEQEEQESQKQQRQGVKSGVAAATKKHPLLPDNHLLPQHLQFFPKLLNLLDQEEKRRKQQQQEQQQEENNTNNNNSSSSSSADLLLKELRETQKEAKDIQDEINSITAAKVAEKIQQQEEKEKSNQESQQSEIVKRCLYFTCIPFSADFISSLLHSIVVEEQQEELILNRWTLAPLSPKASSFSYSRQQQNKNPATTDFALIVQLGSNSSVEIFLSKYGKNGSKRDGYFDFNNNANNNNTQVVERVEGIISASQAIQQNWLAAFGGDNNKSSSSLPAMVDIASLLDSREVSDVVRDLKSVF